jgi:hypothetical protein
MLDMPPEEGLTSESAAAMKEALRLLQLGVDAYLKGTQGLPSQDVESNVVAGSSMGESDAMEDRDDPLAQDGSATEIVWAVIELLERQRQGEGQ